MNNVSELVCFDVFVCYYFGLEDHKLESWEGCYGCIEFRSLWILTVVMDWVSTKYLSKLKMQGEGKGSQKSQFTGRTYIQEKCLKAKGFQFALVNTFSHLFS